MAMTLEDFKAARKVLDGVITPTHLVHSPAFSEACGNQVYLKPENLQVTGAYKIRGAKYPLEGAEITCEYQYGVSNEVLPGQTAVVTVGQGRLLLIKVLP